MVSSATLFAIVLSTVGAQPRGEVLDFSLTYCGPCQQMAPIVEKLAREGHPIRKIDGQQESQLADRFGITRYPTIILLIDGKEVQRESGLLSESDLRTMLAKIPASQPARNVAGNSSPYTNPNSAVNPPGPFRPVLGEAAPLPRPAVREAPAPRVVAQAEEKERMWPFSQKKKPAPEIRASGHELEQPAVASDAPADLFATNARIRVRIGDKVNLGSGTIVESKPGRTLIVTCGHIFRNVNESAKIEVDTAPWTQPKTFVGTLIRYDLDSDVGLISIPTDQALVAVPVARKLQAPKVGEPMVCVGCSGGANPTREQIRITALDKYEGPPTIECEGLPVQGRSGGGLFDAAGRLVGVCINADPQAQRGIYAGLSAIHDLLTTANFAYLHADRETRVAEAEANPVSAQPAAIANTGPESADPFPRSRSNEVTATIPASDNRSASNPEGSAFAINGSEARPVDIPADDAEVVVVIRKKGQPESTSRVIVIHEASPKFFQFLQGELSPNEGPANITANRAGVRRPNGELAAGTTPPVVGAGRPSRAGLAQTTLSEPFQPRPYVRRK